MCKNVAFFCPGNNNNVDVVDVLPAFLDVLPDLIPELIISLRVYERLTGICPICGTSCGQYFVALNRCEDYTVLCCLRAGRSENFKRRRCVYMFNGEKHEGVVQAHEIIKHKCCEG